jgi:hypothetical protein
LPIDVLFPLAGNAAGTGGSPPRELHPPTRFALAVALATAAVCLAGVVGAAWREIQDPPDGDPAEEAATQAASYDFRKLVRTFLEAPTPGEKSALLRDPGRHAGEIAAFYANSGSAAHHIGALAELQTDHFPPDCLAVFWGFLDDGDERLVVIVEDEDGSHRIDWGVFARTNPVAWEDYTGALHTTEQTLDAQFRVIASRCDYFNFAFSSEHRWEAFRVRLPGQDDDVFAYAPKGSPQAVALLERLGGESDQRVALRLRGNNRSPATRQFMLVAMVSPEWVIPGG